MKPQEVMAEVQFLNKYSLYDYTKGRRETWRESVDRAVDYFREVAGDKIPEETYQELNKAIFENQVTPSMRLMATAGKGARRNQISIYNCSYLPLQNSFDFHNLAMLLGHGVGVGFSVESYFVDEWRVLPLTLRGSYSYEIPDSIEGWALSFRMLIDNFFDGRKTIFDYSLLRPAGAPLKTRGGHASGPGPLVAAHQKIERVLEKRMGRMLRSIDLFDIACHVADCIVSGGVRRSAMIAIFDEDDSLMLKAKNGKWWEKNGQRSLANISLVIEQWKDLEWWRNYVKTMDASKAGEPGIWSRHGIFNTLPERREYVGFMGPNPCVEQILRPYQFCNLSQVIARSDDTVESLMRKVRLAALIGTIQSAMTEFKDVNEMFAYNSEDERLLGVSISGIMDCPIISSGDKKVLNTMRNAVIHENKKWAKRLGINPSTSTTCVKPDGNTSVRYDTSPGVHGRHAPYYIRRLQVQAESPIAKWGMWAGIPFEPKFGESWADMKTAVFSFPVKSPDGAIIQRERTAIEQLENWIKFKREYTETNPSVTITYRENELEAIAEWLFTNQDEIVGLSFLAADDHSYEQMPYEEITEQQFEELANKFPKIDFETFWEWESNTDTTEGASTSGCAGGACLI